MIGSIGRSASQQNALDGSTIFGLGDTQDEEGLIIAGADALGMLLDGGGEGVEDLSGGAVGFEEGGF